MLSLGAAPILLLGDDPLAGIVADRLRHGGRSFEQLQRIEQVGTRLRRADVLLLAAVPRPGVILAEVAERCRDRPSRLPPLRVILIEDSDSGAARTATAELSPDVPLRLEPFAIDVRAARLLLGRWPLHRGFDPRFGQATHLVIAGHATPAEALLMQALRSAHYSEQPPHVTLLDDDPQAWRQRFEDAHPQARQFSRLRFLGLDDPGLTEAPPVTSLFVFVDPPTRGLDVADALMRRLADAQQVSPPAMLEVGAARPSGSLRDWDGQLYPVCHRREALSAEVLLDGRGDELARVIHDHYRDTTEAQGRDLAQEAATQPWPALPESYRDANRHQADHLWAKLAVTDCRAVPLEQVESFAFAPIEVERLARIEHNRWAADRWLDGWTYAPERDNARKHHPQLIPYDELSAPMKDLDRFAVRLAPTLLARFGLGIVRMLIVGCLPAPQTAPGRLRGLMRAALTRLVERNPDRGLIIAATLADAPSRLLAQIAMDDFGAGLFLLGDRPVSALLGHPAHGNDDAAGREIRALLTRAERRIPLPAAGELDRWLAQRAEVLVEVATSGEPAPRAATMGAKHLVIDTDRGLDWGFEY